MPKSVSPFESGESITGGQVRDHLNELVGSTNELVGRDTDDPVGTFLPEEPPLGGSSGVLSRIGSRALVPGHQARWLYSMVQVALTSSVNWVDVTGGLSFNAINLVEMAHDVEPASNVEWTVWGVDVHGVTSSYPSGYSPQPLQVGSLYFARLAESSSGPGFWLISGQGGHDGTC